jgi:hypothetical protein
MKNITKRFEGKFYAEIDKSAALHDLIDCTVHLVENRQKAEFFELFWNMF